MESKDSIFNRMKSCLERNKIWFETIFVLVLTITSICVACSANVISRQQVHIDDSTHLPNFNVSATKLDENFIFSDSSYSSVMEIKNSGGYIKNSTAVFQGVLTVYSIEEPQKKWYFKIQNYSYPEKVFYNSEKNVFDFYRSSIDSARILKGLDSYLRQYDDSLYFAIYETVSIEYTDYKSIQHSEFYVINNDHLLNPEGSISVDDKTKELCFTETNFNEEAERIYRLTTGEE